MESKEREVKHDQGSSTIINGVNKRGSEFSLNRKVSFMHDSVSDSGVPHRKTSSTVDGSKRSSLHSQDFEPHSQDETLKIPRKFITTWRQACDRTKDKTKELIKRWKTLPEDTNVLFSDPDKAQPPEHPHNWSVHVWASYIKRYPSDDENLLSPDKDREVAKLYSLSPTQKEKLGLFFEHLIDSDHDDLINEQDFEHFSERLRRYADWSTNSPEFLIMAQVQHELVTTFLPNNLLAKEEELSSNSEHWKQYIGLEEWFQCWSRLLCGAYNLQDFPLWLQYLPKLLFQAINRSGTGIISRDELSSFYSSMLAFSSQKVGEVLDDSFKALTSNGDHTITYQVYRLAFTNFLLGRYPNGPGQYLFGCISKKNSCFPIDYSALNCQPEDREHYTPDRKSNRVSVVV